MSRSFAAATQKVGDVIRFVAATQKLDDVIQFVATYLNGLGLTLVQHQNMTGKIEHANIRPSSMKHYLMAQDASAGHPNQIFHLHQFEIDIGADSDRLPNDWRSEVDRRQWLGSVELLKAASTLVDLSYAQLENLDTAVTAERVAEAASLFVHAEGWGSLAFGRVVETDRELASGLTTALLHGLENSHDFHDRLARSEGVSAVYDVAGEVLSVLATRTTVQRGRLAAKALVQHCRLYWPCCADVFRVPDPSLHSLLLLLQEVAAT